MNIQTLSVPEWAQSLPLAERIIAARGVAEKDIPTFLTASFEDVPSPLSFPRIRECAEKLAEAVRKKKKVLIWSDYDGDGVCSAAILARFFEGHCEYLVHLPERHDGYGFNSEIFAREAARFNPEFVVTVDCGISSGEALDACGVEYIVLDHHEIADNVPLPKTWCNMTLEENPGAWGSLCGAGTAWACCCLAETMLGGKRDRTPWTFLAGIATVTDVMPLRGVNRCLVREALKVFSNISAGKEKGFPGLARLMQNTRLTKATFSATDIAFIIGPCINAAGRLATPRHAYDMLRDGKFAELAADACYSLNEARKELEHEFAQRAKELIPTQGCVLSIDAPSGILGIIAARVSEMTGLPAVVLAPSEDGTFSGSGRAPVGMPLKPILDACAPLLLRYGGHKRAAGCSVSGENLPKFRHAFNQICQSMPVTDIVTADMELDGSMISMEMLDELRRMEPFGEGNPEPLFYIPKAILRYGRNTGMQKQHLSAVAYVNGKHFKANMWRKGELLSDIQEHPRRALLTHVSPPWGDNTEPELTLTAIL